MTPVHEYMSKALIAVRPTASLDELLHTLGATDKYDPQTLQPIHPDGYAEPNRQPRHPQALAEIMAGRIPVAEGRAEEPDSLADTLIGPQTAIEIGLQPRRH